MNATARSRAPTGIRSVGAGHAAPAERDRVDGAGELVQRRRRRPRVAGVPPGGAVGRDQRRVAGDLGRGEVPRRRPAGEDQGVEHLVPGTDDLSGRVAVAQPAPALQRAQRLAPRAGRAGTGRARRSPRRWRSRPRRDRTRGRRPRSRRSTERRRSMRAAASPTAAGWSAAAAWAGTPPRPAVPAPFGGGIGSNATQPMPSNSTSGQASASLPVTMPPPAGVWKPTTTRVGRPSRRQRVANAGGELLRGAPLAAHARFAVQEEAEVRVRVPGGRVDRVRVVLGHVRLHGQRPQVRRALAQGDLLGEGASCPVVRTGRP